MAGSAIARLCAVEWPGRSAFRKISFGDITTIGERVLLQAVRRAAPDTLVVADGFKLREQILQVAGRPAMHWPRLLKMALEPRETLPRVPVTEPES